MEDLRIIEIKIATLPVDEFQIICINGIVQIITGKPGQLIFYDRNGIAQKYYEVGRGEFVYKVTDLLPGRYIATYVADTDPVKIISKLFIR